jgi:hypothetical protein
MTEQIVRCPYCILGEECTPMLPRTGGWSLCLECGHTVMLDDSEFKCFCRKCGEARRAA